MSLWQDVRFAFRSLVKRPGFALVAVATLALGIGANTAVFSLVEGVLLRPLAVGDPDQLVMIWEQNFVRKRTHNVVNPANYLAWRERSRSFEGMTALTAFGINLTDSGEPARIQAGIVTGNFFSTLRVAPALGRGFEDSDSQPNAPRVVILSDGLWKSRFGGDPQVLGRSLTLNGNAATVVGVMRPGFSLPPGVELWVPFTIDDRTRRAGGRFMLTIARLKPGVAVSEARAEMETLAARLAEEEKERDAGWGVTVAPLHADLVRDARPAVLVLMGAVALVLLIACANLANLLLARALSREREMAVRRALGASGRRLLAQLLVESLLLALAGGAAGLGLAAAILEGLRGVLPAQVASLFSLGLNLRVLAFTLGVACLSAVLFGLLPALGLARGHSLTHALREGAAGTGASRERRRLTRVLVAGEMALSVVLLVGAGLLLRSFDRLSRVDPGFDPSQVLSFEISLPPAAYSEAAAVSRFFADATERLARIPGVRAAGAISWRPLPSGGGSATRFTLRDRPVPPPGQEPTGDVRILTPGTFRALGVRLVRGRDFEPADAAGRPDVVVVNERLVREFWPNEDPLGKRVRMEWGREIEAEVVGVVGDVRLTSLDNEARPTLYWHQAQLPNNFMTLLLRTSGPPLDTLSLARAELQALDKQLPLASVTTLEDAVSDSLRRPRFLFSLLAAFALTAMLLAAIGLFGVLSYSVAQRLPEMGVRLALGASPRDLLRLVLADGLRLAAVGIALGLAGALALSRLLASLLFELRPHDPPTFLATCAAVVLVGLLAVALPALRAGRVDPAQALRAE